MKRSTARWTTSLAAAALLGLPAAGLAQTSGTTQPPATSAQQPASPTSQSESAQNAAAQEHLREAKSALDRIAPTAVTGKAKTQLAELKRHLNTLERASGSNNNASASGAAKSNTPSTAATGAANWGTQVAAIDKILTNLLGPVGTTGTASDPTGTAGTSGTTAKPKGTAAVAIDEATRTQLTELRTHVTAYAVAMSGTASDANTAATPSATTSSTATTGTGSMTGSTSGTAGSTTGTTSATGSAAEAPMTAAAQPQVDQEGARRHLTDARDTLTQLTQLPAAAQLSGEARTQVSQLISNFNELITATTEWRGSYTKLDANLDALIGADNTDAEATGGVSTGTTGTTGTTSAVGTSGTAAASAAGMANLDPAIRAKLVELRQKLNQFEKASGSSVTASGAATATTGGSMTGTTGSMTGTTGSMTGSTTGTQSPTPQTATPAGHAKQAMGHEEAMRHIAAIETILNANASGPASATTTGTTAGSTTSATTTGKGLTLTSAQLDQLRTHLTELKRLVGEAKK